MNDLADKILKISIEYIGPAAERFLDRQTTRHLNGLNFANIERDHIEELSKWVKISAGLLIDASRAAELADKIAKA